MGNLWQPLFDAYEALLRHLASSERARRAERLLNMRAIGDRVNCRCDKRIASADCVHHSGRLARG